MNKLLPILALLFFVVASICQDFPRYYSDYLYFTVSESAGGGPFTFGPSYGGQTPDVNTRRSVNFS